MCEQGREKKENFPGRLYNIPNKFPTIHFFMWKLFIFLQMFKFQRKELPRFPTFSSAVCEDQRMDRSLPLSEIHVLKVVDPILGPI